MKINGIYFSSPPPSCAGQDLGNLMILGGSRNVWAEYKEARDILENFEVMAINDMAYQFEEAPLTHAVSLHREILACVVKIRMAKSRLEHVVTHSNVSGPGIEIVWDINSGGTSGLFAVNIGLAMGYKKIVACGVAMDNSGHYYNPNYQKPNEVQNLNTSSNLAPWTALGNDVTAKERVRVVSGRPSSIFGKPTKEWVNG